MNMREEAKALTAHWQTFFLRSIPFIELEMASRLANPDFLDSIFAQSLPSLEQAVALKAHSSTIFDGVQLPSLKSSTSWGTSEAMLYAEKFRAAIDNDSVPQGRFDFLRWLRLSATCKHFFPSVYLRELKGKYVCEDVMDYMD
jgi:hypothetical protein